MELPAGALWLLPGAASLALLSVTFLLARREERALVVVEPHALEGELLVVIPARDEAGRIGPTLEALLREPAPGLRVLVYDDRSSDESLDVARAQAARDPRLVVVDGSADPAPARFGKPAALARALEHADRLGLPAQGRVLFLDADVVTERGALGGLARALDDSGAAALSGVPRLVTGSLVEALLVPAFVSLAARRFPPSKVHDDAQPAAFLNGQLILVERAALDDAGGFAGVADAILEDVALAARLKAGGHALRLADLRQVASTRMYDSLGGIVEGFGKNAVPLQGGPLAAALVGLLGLTTSLAAPLTLAGSLATAPSTWGLAGTAILAGVTLLQAGLRRRLGVPLWPAPLSPLTYAVVAFVLVRAALRVVAGGEVSWRGRRYPASRR